MSKETPNILKKILDYKKEYIENVKRDLPLKELKSMALDCPPARGFTNSILKTIEKIKEIKLTTLLVNRVTKMNVNAVGTYYKLLKLEVRSTLASWS